MQNKVSSLSDAFAPETAYFYGFPTNWDSGFYNACPIETEELVAARPLVCAGKGIKVVSYASTVTNLVRRVLEDLGVELIPESDIIKLPKDIDSNLTGSDRNERIKLALAEQLSDGKLVMAQPYIDPRLERKYLIKPEATKWLNDKDNISKLVPEKYRVPEFARVENGEKFSELEGEKMPYPCVVKVTSSSAGDGVRICRSAEEFKFAQEIFSVCTSTIVVQKYIDLETEADVKFAIKDGEFEVIGYSNEITGRNGEYFGGIVRNNEDKTGVVARITEVLKKEILPKIKEKGWHGIGGVDVLIDKEGNFYFADFNCRMTATMAQTLQSNRGLVGDKSILVLNAEFPGSLDGFRSRLKNVATTGDSNRVLNVVSLSQGKGHVNIHGGVIFDQEETMPENIKLLRKLGLKAGMFDHLGI